MLGSHGLFTWGNTSYESYVNTLDIIETCAGYLRTIWENRPVFGGRLPAAVPEDGTVSQRLWRLYSVIFVLPGE
jgi:rhamnose utilization protein RhaD (predicted bifunctional aldolase and dehydrogenase)